MTNTKKYVLGEDRIPKAWYNIAADLPAPVLNPGTGQPIGPNDLAPLTAWQPLTGLCAFPRILSILVRMHPKVRHSPMLCDAAPGHSKLLAATTVS